MLVPPCSTKQKAVPYNHGFREMLASLSFLIATLLCTPPAAAGGGDLRELIHREVRLELERSCASAQDQPCY